MDSFPDDIWIEIYRVIIYDFGSGSTYKSLIFLSRQTQQVGYKFWIDAKDRLANHLWTLIKMYPNVKWNWDDISANPNTTWKIIQENLHLLIKDSVVKKKPCGKR
jgi:hypothetical protein